MNDHGLLWWLGGTAILMGILGVIGLLALAVDNWYQKHIERNHGAPGDDDDDGSTRLTVALLGATLALALAGWLLYLSGHIGWAQAVWLVGSGLASGAVASWMIDRDRR